MLFHRYVFISAYFFISAKKSDDAIERAKSTRSFHTSCVQVQWKNHDKHSSKKRSNKSTKWKVVARVRVTLP